ARRSARCSLGGRRSPRLPARRNTPPRARGPEPSSDEAARRANTSGTVQSPPVAWTVKAPRRPRAPLKTRPTAGMAGTSRGGSTTTIRSVSSGDFAGLKDVDGFSELPGAPGAAAELAQDVPGLELGIGPLGSQRGERLALTQVHQHQQRLRPRV